MGAFQQEADAKDGKECPGRVYNGFPISFYVTFDLYSFAEGRLSETISMASSPGKQVRLGS
jgi:hypothetical protein